MSTEVNPDDLETIRLAKAEEGKWKAVREAAEAKVKAQLGDEEEGTVDGHVAVTWKTSVATTLDTKALRAAIPEAVLLPYLRVGTPRRTFVLKD